MATTRITVKNHTTVMMDLMDNVVAVFKQLEELRTFVVRRKAPQSEDVLKALIKTPTVSTSSKRIAMSWLKLLPKLQQAERGLPPDMKNLLAEIRKQIDSQKSYASILLFLSKLQQNAKVRKSPKVKKSVQVAATMLVDGLQTIYSSDNHFNAVFAQEHNAIKVAKADIIGAIGGGVAGSIFPGAGTTTGAAAIGIGASAAKTTEIVLDWLVVLIKDD